MRLAVEDRSCTQARLVLSAALDGEAASSSETLAAARHLSACPSCAEFAAKATAFTHVLRIGRHRPSGIRRGTQRRNQGGTT
jgi:predicted anti-sigma-YlaC factor YlaD